MHVIENVYFVLNPMKSVAPDTFQKMSKLIIDKIHDDLNSLGFKGIISLAGYGEPLLHKDINYIVEKLSI